MAVSSIETPWGKTNPAPQSVVELNRARDALAAAADLCAAIEMMACGEGAQSGPYERIAELLGDKIKSARAHLASAFDARVREADERAAA